MRRRSSAGKSGRQTCGAGGAAAAACGERREVAEPATPGGRVRAGVHGEGASEEAEELALDGVGGLVLEEAFQRDSETFASAAAKLTLVSVRKITAGLNHFHPTCPILNGSAIWILAIFEDGDSLSFNNLKITQDFSFFPADSSVFTHLTLASIHSISCLPAIVSSG